MKILSKMPPLLLLSTLLVVGCQNNQPEHLNIPVDKQIQQLSSLVAAAEYLREQCHRSDIPDNTRLIATVLKLAGSKGWNTTQPEYQQLGNGIQQRYQELLTDGTPNAQQCQLFNASLADFLDKAR